MNRLQTLLPIASLMILLGFWHGLALLLDSSNLPLPYQVAQVLWRETLSGQLPYHLGATLLRLVASFSIAMPLGCAAGIVLGRNARADAFFSHWLVVLLNVPALVTIILCYVWFGLVESAAIFAVVVNKLPNVIVTIREGARVLDKDLLEMAHCYQFGVRKTLIHVVWPQLYPFVMSATRAGLALIWKIILIVELLGRSNGMGYQLHLYFQLFDVASILAYTIAFIVVMQLIEQLILKPLEQTAQQWRR